MLLELILRWLHVLGACVLLGTGSGIAFFMLMAHRTGDAKIVYHTAKTVVLADYIFTASAVIVQPITGLWLAYLVGWELTTPWVMLSLGLYIAIGFLWLPVVFMQKTMRDLANEAAQNNEPLPPQYHSLFRRWFGFGVPAFAMVLAIVWLMVARPAIW